MIGSTVYLRRLAILGGGILLYWLLMVTLARAGQGVLLLAHGLAATAVGVAIAYRRWTDELRRLTIISAALVLSAWGIAECGWASSFFLSNKSNRAPLVVLATESGYFVAFLLSIVCMMSAIEGRIRDFFARRVVFIPLALTTPIAFRLILDPFLSNRDVGLTAFNFGETTVIAVSYLALNLALLVLLSTRSLDWSIFAAGILCLVFGDWSVRLDKITGLPIEFGLGSFFILFGLYSSALPFLWRQKLGRIQPFESSSILNSYRVGLLVVALSMVLVFALYQREGVRTLRILCLGSGAVAFVAVFLSQMLVERVQAVSAEIGLVLRSELEQRTESTTSPGAALPIELHEIYRMAFSSTVREQKLREEQRALEQVRQVQEQVAHDIRAPLVALNVAVDTAQEQLPEENRLILQNVASRIRDIADDLMAGKRTEVGEALTKEATSCSLGVLVEEVVNQHRLRLASRPKLSIERLGMNTEGIFVRGQERAFKRALSNLIDNAIEAIADEGNVTVAVSLEGEHALLSISDSGKGIPDEVLAQLGARGFTHDKPDGSGLGLYHARSVIEQSGGQLSIRSQVGSGTTVEIRLVRTHVSSQALRILVIDDDETVAWTWRKRQKRLGITELHIFASMEACESAGLDYKAFAVAFVDLQIKATGWDIGRAIRHLKERGVRRVFVATASPKAADNPDCAGADGIAADKVPAGLTPYLS